ncbi:VWA domain-containing protein [Acidipila sp. EB88]|uniref:VWA domain-containing protein n=1 Tax=Acidipila sp. EB88 TaxID=2305226 RepID=UPI000F6041C1|nr:VWA domain-containing protein [Acidipila sp. EB88]RRA48605.1 VWA domain-containing protein [Acidipila sp. EB88]
MRRVRVAALWLWILTLPCLVTAQNTVEHLQGVLAAQGSKSDADIAKMLAAVALSERLSPAALAHVQAQAPGPRSRQALEVLADTSAFLPLPGAETPAIASPDLATQRQILALTVNYVLKTVHQLPNFSAQRVTTSFNSAPWEPGTGGADLPGARQLTLLGTRRAEVSYRDGGELVHTGANDSAEAEQGLTTAGEFGPILNTALLDAGRSKLAWSHWERSALGIQAVFRYAVPAAQSHYDVKYCCTWRQNGDRVYFDRFTGYQGEMAVDPASGAVLRLTLVADLKPTDPIRRAAILVEYGPVVIGGTTYICPTKSVALSVGLEIRNLQQGSANSLGLLQTSLNDVVFEQYHVFRAEVRVLAAGDASAHGPPSSSTAPADLPTASAGPSGESAPAANSSASTGLPVTSAAGLPTLSAVSSPGASTPEVSVTGTAVMPAEAPLQPTSDLSSRNRVETRSQGSAPVIAIAVMASDRKGRPVTDLTANDVEVYDQGRRQQAQTIAAETIPAALATGTAAARVAPGNTGVARAPAAYSNSNSAPQGTAFRAANSDLTALLFDVAGLRWAELESLRAQILRALPALPADEAVALYEVRGQTFQVVQEGTRDRALLASRLQQWLPRMQDLLRTQQAEEPDQLGADEHSVGTGATAQALSREVHALTAVCYLAHTLARTPGRKNLVWMTHPHEVATSQGSSELVNNLVPLAEQALHDAEVTLYPLDAAALMAEPGTGSVLAGMQADAGPRTAQVTEPQQGSGNTAQSTGRTQAAAAAPASEMEQAAGRAAMHAVLERLARATGGRALRKGALLSGELPAIIAEGRAVCWFSFTPDLAADNAAHELAVKLSSRHGVTLRYPTGYRAVPLPQTRRQRFDEAVWQPGDTAGILLRAVPAPDAGGGKLVLSIATASVSFRMQDERWTDKLDIFLVERDEAGWQARITGQTLQLALKTETLQSLAASGIRFDQALGMHHDSASVRVVVVDENSGNVGTVTVPAYSLTAEP